MKRKPIGRESSEVLSIVDSVTTEINNKFGAGTAMVMSGSTDSDLLDIPFWVKTGIPALDYAIGGSNHPGIPGGRIIEIFGPESHGKTTVALWILKKLIEIGGLGIYQDTEFALSDERAEQMGVDRSAIVYSQPETMEEVFEQQEAIIDVIRNKQDFDRPVGLFWDSVASSPTRSEIDGDYGDAVMGIHARLMSQSLRKIRGIISKQKIMAVYINQIRDKIGVLYGEKTNTFGGRALKFYASVRIQVTQVEKIKLNNELIGIKVQAEVKKNKVAPPFKKAVFRIMFYEEGGIDQAGAILDWLKDNNLAGESSGWYEIEGKKRRYDEARSILLEDKDLFQKYLDLCYTLDR